MDLFTQTVTIYRIGTFVEISGIRLESGEAHKAFEIIKVRLEVDDAGITHRIDIIAVSDEGDDLCKGPITINPDMYDIKCI